MDRITKFFCSLRLTVVLLTAGLLLVFFGTLAQVHEGLFQAQARYFRSWYIWQPTIGDSKWPILLPGGYLIGSLLLFNLAAAHIQRFRFTVKQVGIHLTHGGIILLLLGQLLTDMLSRESAMKLVEGMSKNYSEDFRVNELVFINKSDSKMDTVVSIPEQSLAKLGDIKNDSLPVKVRVLNYWQNCEVGFMPPPGTTPVHADHGAFPNAGVLPVANAPEGDETVKAVVHVEVFNEKGSLGTYLFFSGVEGSQPQIISAGKTDYTIGMLFAPMMGGNLLAVTKVGSVPGEGMVTFTPAELMRKGELLNASLPFKLRVKDFWPQAKVYPLPGKTAVQPKITAGSGIGGYVTPAAPVTDTDHRNLPAVVVELVQDGKSLGSYLMWTGWGDTSQPSESIMLAGKPYEMSYQFKRYYENYRMGLVKFTHDQYKGTDIPSNFASRIRIMNPAENEDRTVQIKMNSPLRYKGTTYYQAGFDDRRPDVTILQVVTNPSWLTPYFACIIVGIGLIYQFSLHLVGFATKKKKK